MDGIKPLLDMVAGFGTAAPAIGLLAFLWWTERTERREMVAKVISLNADSIDAEKDMTQALQLLASKVTK